MHTYIYIYIYIYYVYSILSTISFEAAATREARDRRDHSILYYNIDVPLYIYIYI